MLFRQRLRVLHQTDEWANIITANCYRHHFPIIFEIDSFVLFNTLNQRFCLYKRKRVCEIKSPWNSELKISNGKKFNHHKRHITRYSANLSKIELRCFVEWKWVTSWITEQLDSDIAKTMKVWEKKWTHAIDYTSSQSSSSRRSEANEKRQRRDKNSG